MEPRGGVVPSLAANSCRRLAHKGVVLAVKCHDEARFRGRAQGRHEVLFVQRWKLGDAAIAEERLHTNRASLAQLAQARGIGVDQTAP